MSITFEPDHTKTWFLNLNICFNHVEIHWNKIQSCVTTPHLHKYNMAAMQGEIAIENVVKHEWKHDKCKECNAFWRTIYNLHSKSTPPQKTHSVTDVE